MSLGASQTFRVVIWSFPYCVLCVYSIYRKDLFAPGLPGGSWAGALPNASVSGGEPNRCLLVRAKLFGLLGFGFGTACSVCTLGCRKDLFAPRASVSGVEPNFSGGDEASSLLRALCARMLPKRFVRPSGFGGSPAPRSCYCGIKSTGTRSVLIVPRAAQSSSPARRPGGACGISLPPKDHPDEVGSYF